MKKDAKNSVEYLWSSLVKWFSQKAKLSSIFIPILFFFFLALAFITIPGHIEIYIYIFYICSMFEMMLRYNIKYIMLLSNITKRKFVLFFFFFYFISLEFYSFSSLSRISMKWKSNFVKEKGKKKNEKKSWN